MKKIGGAAIARPVKNLPVTVQFNNSLSKCLYVFLRNQPQFKNNDHDVKFHDASVF